MSRRLRPDDSAVPEAGEGEEGHGAPKQHALLPRDVGPGGSDGGGLVSAAPLAQAARADEDELIHAECAYCSEGLTFRADGSGWTHRVGGLYAKRCLRCRITSSEWGDATFCPLCESWMLVDHHVATPDRGAGRA